MRENAHITAGSKLFNALPTSLRSLSGISAENFKTSLDMLLSLIPDEPCVLGLTSEVTNLHTARASNSLVDVLNHHKDIVDRFESSISSTSLSTTQVFTNINPATSLPVNPAYFGTVFGIDACSVDSTQTLSEGSRAWPSPAPVALNGPLRAAPGTLLGPSGAQSQAPGATPGPGAAPGTLHGAGCAQIMHARSRNACGGASGAARPNDASPPGLPGTGSSGDVASLDEGAGCRRVPCSGLTSPAPPCAGGPRSIGPGSVRLLR